MDRSRRVFILIIIFISTIVPYCATIFFLRSDYTIAVVMINIFCLFLLIISYIGYAFRETKSKLKTIILISVPFLVVMFFVKYGYILEISNYAHFKIISKKDYIFLLNETKNFEFKQIVVSRNREIIRIDNYEYGNDSIQTQLKISKDLFQSIINKMSENGIYYVNKHNGIVYFTNGGFIDSESGYAYSESNEKPLTNHTGKVLTWQKVDDNWYYWYAD